VTSRLKKEIRNSSSLRSCSITRRARVYEKSRHHQFDDERFYVRLSAREPGYKKRTRTDGHKDEVQKFEDMSITYLGYNFSSPERGTL